MKTERDLEQEKPVVAKPENPIELDVKYLKQNTGEFGNFGYGNITVICFMSHVIYKNVWNV